MSIRSCVFCVMPFVVLLAAAGCRGSDNKAFDVVSEATYTVEEKWVTASDGNQIYTRWAYPARGGPVFPAVIFVPSLLKSGGTAIEEASGAALLKAGYAVVAFNPEGRGSNQPGDLKSDGVEDYDGFIDQDDLLKVIETAGTITYIDSGNVGVISSSFGITMAAGCLGRHTELNVKFLIDVEGPTDSYVSMGDAWMLDSDPENDRFTDTSGTFLHASTAFDPSPANKIWWSEREGINYIGLINVPYMRIQGYWDHAQPPSEQYQTGFDVPPTWYQNKHAIDMVNAATHGSSPWTCVNGSDLGNTPNALYSYEHPPAYYSGALDPMSSDYAAIIVSVTKEMFALNY